MDTILKTYYANKDSNQYREFVVYFRQKSTKPGNFVYLILVSMKQKFSKKIVVRKRANITVLKLTFCFKDISLSLFFR